MNESRKALDSFTRLDKETNDIEEMRRSLRTRSTAPAQPPSQRKLSVTVAPNPSAHTLAPVVRCTSPPPQPSLSPN